MGGFSIWHWLIVLVIVALVFGTKKLRNIGEALKKVGAQAEIKGFRKGMQEGDEASKPAELKADPPSASAQASTNAKDRAEG